MTTYAHAACGQPLFDADTPLAEGAYANLLSANLREGIRWAGSSNLLLCPHCEATVIPTVNGAPEGLVEWVQPTSSEPETSEPDSQPDGAGSSSTGASSSSVPGAGTSGGASSNPTGSGTP